MYTSAKWAANCLHLLNLCSGFGFVKFSTEGDAKRAVDMKKMDFKGREIALAPAKQ
jgi:RNA recognition motif-containing protein